MRDKVLKRSAIARASLMPSRKVATWWPSRCRNAGVPWISWFKASVIMEFVLIPNLFVAYYVGWYYRDFTGTYCIAAIVPCMGMGDGHPQRRAWDFLSRLSDWGWRPRPELNRGTRFCRPLRNHSATWPFASLYMGLIARGNTIRDAAMPVPT